jgi:hypothetical protein
MQSDRCGAAHGGRASMDHPPRSNPNPEATMTPLVQQAIRRITAALGGVEVEGTVGITLSPSPFGSRMRWGLLRRQAGFSRWVEVVRPPALHRSCSGLPFHQVPIASETSLVRSAQRPSLCLRSRLLRWRHRAAARRHREAASTSCHRQGDNLRFGLRLHGTEVADQRPDRGHCVYWHTSRPKCAR